MAKTNRLTSELLKALIILLLLALCIEVTVIHLLHEYAEEFGGHIAAVTDLMPLR